MTTRILLFTPKLARRRITSKPSSFGMAISRIIKSGGASRAKLKACTPLEASWTALKFSCCSKFLIEARIRGCGSATSALGMMGSTIGSVSAAKLKGEVRQTHL